MKTIETLISVPPGMSEYLNEQQSDWCRRRLRADADAEVFVTSDPAGSRLGSGGGTIHLLHECKRQQGSCDKPLGDWLSQRQRLIIHAGGQSRRLPAYASIGKLFLPVPFIDGLSHQRFDQILADFQIPPYRQVLHEAGSKPAIMINSGDVLLQFNPLSIPEVQADIVGLGMRVSPTLAQHFGVFFIDRRVPVRQPEKEIALFLQKPSVDDIRGRLAEHEFYVDTGMWLLSAKAVEVLFRACGWNEKNGTFATPDGYPAFLDLYTDIGTSLGDGDLPPRLAEAGFGDLTRSVVPLPAARFFHLGSSQQIFSFLEESQLAGHQRQEYYFIGTPDDSLRPDSKSPVWADSCSFAAPIHTNGNNMLTGLPAGNAVDSLDRGWCVDVTPMVDGSGYALRPYHLEDNFRGPANDEASTICGLPAPHWLRARGFPACDTDVFNLTIYPILRPEQISQSLVDWFFAVEPDHQISQQVREWPRRSSRQIGEDADIARQLANRQQCLAATIDRRFRQLDRLVSERFFHQDFAALAEFIRDDLPELRQYLLSHRDAFVDSTWRPSNRARLYLFLAGLAGSADEEEALTQEGFRQLREAITHESHVGSVIPELALKRDQIVWARSPLRLDLAGGWTDTPPYCIEFGGSVVNMAVMLNGQPPIQVIARVLEEPELRLRSIDLGFEQVLHDFDDLADFNQPGAAFSLPKAALYLCGFHPRFYDGSPYRSLREQLEAFGGGLELSLLCAVPKGSGLGTSSVLAATLLGALGRACNLDFGPEELYHRVLAMEQLLTTGGGWQDQAGALYRGIKRIETQPGPGQHPVVHYLPEFLFSPVHANRTCLLYYTGLTRLAKDILQKIVRNMFLGERETLNTLSLIRANAEQVYNAILTSEQAALLRGIDRSWHLNRRLDPHTTTDQIEAIFATCGEDLAAAKLLGAGGGGYMFICASSPEGGERIRRRLLANPPNPLARFVDFAVADSGMQVTVS